MHGSTYIRNIFAVGVCLFSNLRLLICNHFSVSTTQSAGPRALVKYEYLFIPCCADPHKQRAKTYAQNIYSMHTRVVFHTGIKAQCVCCGVRIPSAHVLTFVFAGCPCRWINIDYAANIMRVVPYRCLWVGGRSAWYYFVMITCMMNDDDYTAHRAQQGVCMRSA